MEKKLKRGIFISILGLVITLVIAFFFPINTEPVSSLSGRIIFIDPGHGGKDDGAARSGVVEDEINLQIAGYLFEKCMEEGAKTLIMRSGDYDLASLYATNRKREDLAKRVKYINESQANFFISLHVNAHSNESVRGPMVYFKNNCETSLALAKSIGLQLNSFTKTNKPIHSEDYYLFRKTSIPGILVEIGFLSNTSERNNLIKETYQKNLANAIYQGINDYFMGLKT